MDSTELKQVMDIAIDSFNDTFYRSDWQAHLLLEETVELFWGKMGTMLGGVYHSSKTIGGYTHQSYWQAVLQDINICLDYVHSNSTDCQQCKESPLDDIEGAGCVVINTETDYWGIKQFLPSKETPIRIYVNEVPQNKPISLKHYN